MYLRESRRRNKDGTAVSYLQLAHNERHPRTGSPVAKVIHNFGRADLVDREALRRLVASISRFLEPEQAVAAAAAAEVEVLDSRRMGGAWVLDRLRERLEIGAAVRRVAAGRRLDGEAAERVIFALAAQRATRPGPPPSTPRILPCTIAHMLLGHRHTAAWDQLIRLLAPNVDQVLVQLILGRGAYSTAEEREAETLASLILSSTATR